MCRTTDEPIEANHYVDVDKELRDEYEIEFGINSKNYSMKLITLEEKIEKLSQMLVFWDKHRPNIDIDERDPYKIAKVFYVSDMKSQTLRKIRSLPEELQKAIGDRYRTLHEENPIYSS